MLTKFETIQIYGPIYFADATIGALSLLRSSRSFREVIETGLQSIRYFPVTRRRLSEAAEAFPSESENSVHIYLESLLSDLNEFALLLAHEAYHNYIYSQFMRHGNRRLWKWHRRYYPYRDETRCLMFEIQLCKELCFPIESLNWRETFAQAIPNGFPRKQTRILNHLRRLSLNLCQ